MIFTHSGNSGDIIFSIPTINHLSKEAILYVKPAKYVYGDQYTFLKDFLLLQDIKEVIPFTPPDNNWNFYHWPGLKYDCDLDIARQQRYRGRIHIIKRYFDAFGINKDHRIVPFLKIDDRDKRNERFALIHLTPRWNGLQYDWAKIYKEALERHGTVYFIGLQCEWLDFVVRFGQIEHLQTENILEMARLIRDCEALYCNQGVALTLAVGLNKKYYLVKNGYKTNCHLGIENENLIGYKYLIRDHTLGMPPDSHLTR